MVKIFDMENDDVIINPNCLLIPEFKAIMNKYKEPLKALAYVHFMTSLESPYNDVPEADKQTIISEAVGGDFGFEDEEIDAALELAQKLYTTPTKRFYLDAKVGLEKMGKYLRTSTIEGGRDGNDSTYLSMLKSLATINKAFKDVEKDYNNEISSAVRGGHERSFDE